MQSKKMSNTAAKTVKKILDKNVSLDMCGAATVFFHQPRVPKKLEMMKKNRD